MDSVIASQLSDSAYDFVHTVWPQLKATPLIKGGEIRPVEAVAAKAFKDELDLLAGIDAWHVHHAPTAVRGIASRVQWGSCHDSFTVRTRVPSGSETEFQKRLRAIQSRDEGHLYPHLTIQAYLQQRRGALLAAAVIRTQDLIGTAALLIENRERLRPMPELYGFVANADGTEFLYMKWAYLRYKDLLADANVIRAVPMSA
jgi:hypothetical protein